MIPFPGGARVWLATGRTDMRKGMNGLALQVQEVLERDPYSGHLFVFRGRRGDLIKILWHDTQQRVDETRLQPDGSGSQVTTSIAVSVPEAMMRTTSAALLAVARASRCAEARARNSRGVPAPTSRRMIRPRL